VRRNWLPERHYSALPRWPVAILKKEFAAQAPTTTRRSLRRRDARNPWPRKEPCLQSCSAAHVCLRPAHQRGCNARGHGDRRRHGLVRVIAKCAFLHFHESAGAPGSKDTNTPGWPQQRLAHSAAALLAPEIPPALRRLAWLGAVCIETLQGDLNKLHVLVTCHCRSGRVLRCPLVSPIRLS